MPPNKIKLNTDPNQRLIAFMFGKKPNELEDERTDDEHESKQNVLVDLSVQQVKNETGTDWTIMFNFDIHFIDTSSQQIDDGRDVEIESASTPRTATPMETEGEGDDDIDEDSDSDGDIARASASDG